MYIEIELPKDMGGKMPGLSQPWHENMPKISIDGKWHVVRNITFTENEINITWLDNVIDYIGQLDEEKKSKEDHMRKIKASIDDAIDDAIDYMYLGLKPIKNPLDGATVGCEGGNKVKTITLADGRVFVDEKEKFDIMADFIVKDARITFDGDGIELVTINGKKFEPAEKADTTAMKNKGQYGDASDTWLICNKCNADIILLNTDIKFCPHCGRKIV